MNQKEDNGFNENNRTIRKGSSYKQTEHLQSIVEDKDLTIKKGSKQTLAQSMKHNLSSNLTQISIQSQLNSSLDGTSKVYFGEEIGDIQDFGNDKLIKDEGRINQINLEIEWSVSYFYSINPNLDTSIMTHIDFILCELSKQNCYLGKFLAKGGEGFVFEGIIKREQDKQEVAFKIILNGDIEEVDQQIGFIERFNNKANFIEYINCIELSEDIIVLILKKCEYSLKQELHLIQSIPLNFTLEKFFKMILDLFDGLIQLRLFKILHLDIKPDNILVTKEGSYLYSDFGLSQKYSTNKQQMIIKGFTPKYAPKEQILVRTDEIDYKSDIYSLGKTIKEIVNIFKGLNQKYDIIERIEKEILDKILDEKIQMRYDCQQCHGILLEILFQSNSEQKDQILISYSSRIQNILEQVPNSLFKDIYFYQRIYYHYQDILERTSQIKINHMKQQDVKTLIEFLNKKSDKQIHLNVAFILNNVRLCFSDIRESALPQIHQLKYFKIVKELFEEIKETSTLSFENTENHEVFNLNSCSYQNFQNNEPLQGDQIFFSNYLSSIGQKYRQRGDSQIALQFYLISHKIKEKFLRKNDLSIADSLNNIGLCYRGLGDSKIALNYLLQSLEMYKILLDKNRLSVAHSLSSVGLCYRDIGQPQNALQYQLESLNIKKQLFPKNNPDIAYSLDNIAQCYYDLKDLNSAYSYSKNALDIKSFIFKDPHPSIALSFYNIGLYDNWDINTEFPLRQQVKSLKMYKELFKINHPSIIIPLNNIGLYLLDDAIIKANQNIVYYRLKRFSLD